MIRFIRQKIKNQIWLSLCLTLGISLLAATFCCLPMFRAGAVSTLIQGLFSQYVEEKGEYPAMLGRSGTVAGDGENKVKSMREVSLQYDDYWEKNLVDIPIVGRFYKMSTKDYGGAGYDGRNGDLGFGYIENLFEHASVVKGEYQAEMTKEGYYPCVITELTMDRRNLMVGQVYTFDSLPDDKGNPLKVQITGVFKEDDPSDSFWQVPLYGNYRTLYMDDALLNQLVDTYHIDKVFFDHTVLLDYDKIDGTNVDRINDCIERFETSDIAFKTNLKDIFGDFFTERTAITMMLWVLSLPLFGMLVAFIYMVSGQIVEVEKNEIAALKSRGVFRHQVIFIYILRSSVIALFGIVLGLPLGYLFCKIGASTTDFLTFEGNYGYLYQFVWDMLWYAFLAGALGVLFILIPVVIKSKTSIVQVKSSYKSGVRMFWEKYFLDVVLLGASIYFLVNFNKTSDEIRMKILAGNKMDPFIFLNTCLFIVAAGLISFRLMHYFVLIVYHLGKKFWKPVWYVSFLQISRTFRKQTFITVFMILTVSMGLFDANVARTINRNREDRIAYNLGADVIFQETWEARGYLDENNLQQVRYLEPAYERLSVLKESGLCDSYTKVLRYAATKAEGNRNVVGSCMVFGIDTKDFGETAFLKDEFNVEKHWYHYLNALAEKPDGVIISRNMAEKMTVKEGDAVKIHEVKGGNILDKSYVYFTVVAIVDVWPGYEQYYYAKGEEKERYLAVVNQSFLSSKTMVAPYEIWTKLSDEATPSAFMTFLQENVRPLSFFHDKNIDIVKMKASPRIQITNGIFTLSFIVALVLCGVGFLIYWISSIGQRELLFGVYRAMGFSVGEVIGMLLCEHVFSTFLSVLAGGGVGVLTTFLFAKLYGIVYLPEASNLNIFIYYELDDMKKLFFIIFMMIAVCLLILMRTIRKMNITQALKLGED